ncbi:MAG TPA: NAD(P)-binding domain-containing protein [Candidatus Saccharimonas sp.]|nr:NAD(P)-binding domain-containing protein [Candidatus Saccharimonas sp.]
METLTQVGIIGAGEFGHALGGALTRAHMQVLYFDRDPKRSTTGSIEDLTRSCQVLIVCTPSWAVKDICKQLARAAHPNEPRLVITAAKGVEAGFVTMDQLLRDKLPKNYDTGLLYGPMIAAEIDRNRPAYGILALSRNTWFANLRNELAAANIGVQASGDIHGVALCGVLKNVYAIGCGLVDGLTLGVNIKSKFATLVLAELKRILADSHCDPATAEGIAGLGDLLATGFGEESFNYRVGKSLAERIASEHLKSEGLVTLHEFGKHSNLKKYPLIAAIDSIVFHYAEPETLMTFIAGQ